MHFVTEFEDSEGNRLDVILDHDQPHHWTVYARFRRPYRISLRGATSRHTNEKHAHLAHRTLEAGARALGWPLRRIITPQAPPRPMVLTPTGQKLFCDARTGELFVDESASRPLPASPGCHPAVMAPVVTIHVCRPTDAFDLDSLPAVS